MSVSTHRRDSSQGVSLPAGGIVYAGLVRAHDIPCEGHDLFDAEIHVSS